MSNASIGQEKISFEEFMSRQQSEIMSSFNRWVAGEKFGRDPTPDELVRHYIESGGSARFRENNPVEE